MARAASHVDVQLTLKGQDRASGAINRAGKSADRASSSFSKMGAAVARAGAVLGAVAAAGAVVKRLAEMATETERLRASMDSVFGADGLQVAIDTARAIGGVGVQSVAKLARTLDLAGIKGKLTVDQLKRITEVATKAGKSGDEALTAFAAAIEKGNTRSLLGIGIHLKATPVLDAYAKSIGKSASKLDAAESSQAVFNAAVKQLTGAAGAASGAHTKLDTALGRLDVGFTELRANISAGASGELADLVAGMSTAIEVAARYARVIMALVKAVRVHMFATFGAGITAIKAFSKAMDALARGDISGAKDSALKVFGDELGTVKDAWVDLIDEINAAASGKASKAVGAIGGFIGPRQVDAGTGKGKGRGKGKGKGRGKLPSMAIEQAEFEALARLTPEDEAARIETAKRIKIEEFDFAIFLLDREVAAHQRAVDEKLKIDKAAQTELDKWERKRQEGLDKWRSGLQAVGGAIVQVAQITGASAKQIAPIKLAMALGEAALLFMKSYPRDYVGMGTAVAGAAIAAAQFGAVMGSSSSPPNFTGSGGGGGGFRDVGSRGGGGGGRTVNVTFSQGVILGDEHTIARSIKGALTRIEATGY